MRLLREALEFRAKDAPRASESVPEAAAFAELDEWAVRNLNRFEAPVQRQHPKYAGLFSGLDASAARSGAIAGAMLLDGQSNLEQRSRRSSPGSAVIATLTRRGLTGAEHDRPSALVDVTRRAPAVPEETTFSKEHREPELLALYSWYRDWSLNARAVIRRKDYLISHGAGGAEAGDGEGWGGGVKRTRTMTNSTPAPTCPANGRSRSPTTPSPPQRWGWQRP
jgi:hypothetical protein